MKLEISDSESTMGKPEIEIPDGSVCLVDLFFA